MIWHALVMLILLPSLANQCLSPPLCFSPFPAFPQLMDCPAGAYLLSLAFLLDPGLAGWFMPSCQHYLFTGVAMCFYGLFVTH